MPGMPRPSRRRESLSPEAVELIAARFRILGEPIRIRILQELKDGPKNVTELVAAVGSSQPNVSKHLRILQDSGVIGRRQEGNLVYYTITDSTVIDLCDVVRSSVGDLLKAMAKLGSEMRR
jgi:DNA-binding transcriptional ArsR family regulator